MIFKVRNQSSANKLMEVLTEEGYQFSLKIERKKIKNETTHFGFSDLSMIINYIIEVEDENKN